ncbi:MAG TPA: hypothetical protein VN969_47270 [Streptosporangiaceae bacterium]|nr:hypothetical protein [Streptosporangiaceae bacterium]
MHPENAKTIAARHHEELRQHMAESRRGPVRQARRFFPRGPRGPRGLNVSWSRTVLSADAGRPRGSSLVIIISARRPA